jgi:hypothetical protein
MRRLMARVRGAILRLAYARLAATCVGAAMLLGALALVLREFSWETWATDGLALVAGATGAALIVIGLQGRRTDWIE